MGTVNEYLTKWFKMGLAEIGITEEKYQSMTQEEKNEVRKTLEEYGH